MSLLSYPVLGLKHCSACSILMPVKYTFKACGHSSWMESAAMDWSGPPSLPYVYAANSGDQRAHSPWRQWQESASVEQVCSGMPMLKTTRKTTDVQRWEPSRTVDWDNSLQFWKLCRLQMINPDPASFSLLAWLIFISLCGAFALGMKQGRRNAILRYGLQWWQASFL